MDHLDYLALENQRRDAGRVILGMFAFLFFAGGLVCLGLASQKTETKSSGHLWWAEEKTVAVPTETRLALLLAGVLLVVVAFTLALILYRIVSHGGGEAGGGNASSVTSGVATESSSGTSGHTKEFWIQTTIAVLGLLIAAVGAAAAWWA